MKRILWMVMSLMLIAGAVPALAQDDPCMVLGGTADAETGACVVEAGLNISTAYPLDAMSRSGALTEAANTFIDSAVGDVVSGFAEASADLGMTRQWQLYVESDVLEGVSTLSVVFSRYQFSGGANGWSDYTTYTIDSASDALLTLTELFADGVDPYATLQPLAEAALVEQLGDMAVPDMMNPGLEPTEENYAAWALTTESLVLYFDEYQVAPGAAGALTVEIPLSDLSGVLRPEFVG